MLICGASFAGLAVAARLTGEEALESDDLDVCFQPKVELATGVVRGAEATAVRSDWLIDWGHAPRLLSPPWARSIAWFTSWIVGALPSLRDITCSSVALSASSIWFSRIHSSL